MYKLKDITIVIPSIIKDLDQKWIRQINNFSNAGISILISIPPGMDAKEVYKKGFIKNILIINSDSKGQVKQRIYAYKFCKTKLILHMDDDIFINLTQISGLVKIFSNLPNKSCLAPVYKRRKSRIYNNLRFSAYLRNIFLYFNLKPRSGTISISCYPVPFNFNKKKEVQEVDWLPGGILLLRKLDRIKKNYFRFSGKAYCEDLFHSFFLKKNKINLFITNQFYFYTKDLSYKSLQINEFIKYIISDFQIRNQYRKEVRKPVLPFLISYFFIVMVYLGNKIIFCKNHKYN